MAATRTLLCACAALLLCGYGLQKGGSSPSRTMNGTTLYVLSDLHSTYIASFPSVDTLMNRISRDSRSIGLVLAGDAIVQSASYDSLVDVILAAGQHVWASPSNHDGDPEALGWSTTGADSSKRYWADSTDTGDGFSNFSDHFPEINDSGYGSSTYKDLLMLFVNNCADTTGADGRTYSYSGTMSAPGWWIKTSYHSNTDPGVTDSTAAQWTWLKATLSNDDRTHRLAFTGRAWYSANALQAGRPPIRSRGRGTLLDLLERRGVRAIFESDPHAPGVTSPIRAEAIVTPTATTDYAYHLEGAAESSQLRTPTFDAWPDSTFWTWKWGVTTEMRQATIYQKLTFAGKWIYVESLKCRDYDTTDSLCHSFTIAYPGVD